MRSNGRKDTGKPIEGVKGMLNNWLDHHWPVTQLGLFLLIMIPILFVVGIYDEIKGVFKPKKPYDRTNEKHRRANT